MDWFAVVSLGVYPTIGVTVTQRAAYAVSYGLLGSVSTAVASRARGLGKLGMDLTTT